MTDIAAAWTAVDFRPSLAIRHVVRMGSGSNQEGPADDL